MLEVSDAAQRQDAYKRLVLIKTAVRLMDCFQRYLLAERGVHGGNNAAVDGQQMRDKGDLDSSAGYI